MDFDSLSLSDFDIVASDAIPAITLDRQRRFYINVSARRLLGIKPHQRLSVAYSPDKRLLAVIRPNVDATPAEKAALATSSYNVTDRYYMSARLFAREYGFEPDEAPYSFDYVHGRSDGSMAMFKLREQ